MEQKIVLAVIMADDGKTVTGLGANVPLNLAFLAILAHDSPGVPHVDIKLVPASSMSGPRPPETKARRAVDLSFLRSRSECPAVVPAGPAADMLSILSDKILGGN